MKVTKKNPIEDLETVDPKGRLDVLAYRAAERLTNQFEERMGLSGVWPAIKPEVQKLVVQGLGMVDIPPAVPILLMIVQANMNKKVD